jgi:hypothetical protein
MVLSFLLICIPCFVLTAEFPSWIKSGKSPLYPTERFLTAVGKGATEKEAIADSQKNIIQKVMDTLILEGFEKVKISISPATLLKAFEERYSYNDKENRIYYVFATVDKNMARIDIEDDLYAAEQALQYRTAVYETSNISVALKIKAVNELLELYARRDSIVMLKKALSESIVNTEVGAFEREKLAMDRKKLFENIVYYINAENFNTAKLAKFMEINQISVLGRLPQFPPDGSKAVVVINCKIQLDKTIDKDNMSCNWIADLVLSDAFNEKTMIYSDTATGDETGADVNESILKALSAAEKEMNLMAEEFFKNIN